MSRLLFLGVGAALMYFADPQVGRKRRNDFKNQLDASQRKLLHAREVVVKDATNRTHGMLLETREWLQERREITGVASARLGYRCHRAQKIGRKWMRTHCRPAPRSTAGSARGSPMWAT